MRLPEWTSSEACLHRGTQYASERYLSVEDIVYVFKFPDLVFLVFYLHLEEKNTGMGVFFCSLAMAGAVSCPTNL